VMVFPMCSWGFEGFGANKFNDLANKHLAPKAEVSQVCWVNIFKNEAKSIS
jgi:hypothetical protein